jgi:DNA-binding transcriptional ArsR family regulator
MNPVDAPHWMTVSKLAASLGISKQAISKHAAKLVASHGLEVERTPRGHIARINSVDFNRLRAAYGDSARHRPALEPTASPTPPAVPGTPSLDGERIKALQLSSEQKRLELAEQRGLLIRHDRLGEGLQRLGEELARAADLTQHADALAAAAAQGLRPLRIELKRLTIALRTDLAEKCRAVAIAAPAIDQPLPETLFAIDEA